jgi:hypothetical protein
MQPHYLGDLSKTSRTLGGPDEGDHQYLKKSGAIGTVIRRAPRIHKRNKIRTIPYYEKKHKLGQRVSYQFPNHLFFSESFKNPGPDQWLLSI